MVRKVGYIFDILDGMVKGGVQDVDTETCTICLIADLDVNAVGTRLGRLQEHILDNFSLDILAHLMYLFALGVPAYRIRFYVPLSLTTIEKTINLQ